MDDILKIILQAKLEDSSIDNIKEKLNQLKNQFSEIKIKFVEEGNFSQSIDKLSKNLETLTNRISSLSENQIQNLKNVSKQSEKNAQSISESLSKQEEKYKDLIESGQQLLKTQQKLNTTNKEPVQKTEVTGNQFVQRTKTTDLENNEILSETIKEDTAKIRKEIKNYEEAVKDLTRIRKELENQISEKKDLGLGKSVTSPLSNVLKDLNPSILTENGKASADWQEKYTQATERVNNAIQKSQKYEKNLIEIRKVQNDLNERRNALAEKGYDVSSIAQMQKSTLRWNKENQEVMQGIKDITAQLSKLEKHDETFNKLSNQAQKMGVAFQNTFNNLKSPEQLNTLQSKLTQINQQINNTKKDGLLVDEKEIQNIQERIDALKREASVRESLTKQRLNELKEGSRIKGDAVPEDMFKNQDRVSEIFKNKSYLGRTDEARELATEYVRLITNLDNLNSETARISTTTDKFGKEIIKVTHEIRNSQNVIERYEVAIDQATNSIYDLGRATKEIGNQRTVWDNLVDSIKRVPVYMASFGIAYEVMNQLANSFQILYEVDEAMTNLGKVTTATSQEFADFRKEANLLGQELGSTTADVTTAVAEFQKLGYNFAQSKGLAETALIYANVGDMDIEQATSNMISSLKGFNVAQEDVVQESVRYNDIFNEVANQYAIDSAGIGEALKRSSSALSEAGNDVESAVAMITAANEIIQKPSKVGTAMKTISMRLRGVEEDINGVVTTIPALGSMFRQVGIDIMDSSNSFKSTYEIMNDLAQIWNTGVLTDMQKASMVEAIGGKEHGTVVTALLTNWEVAMNSYTTATQSAGSATEEFSKYQDSLVFRVDAMKTAYEGMWLAFWDNEAVKQAVVGITALINAITKFIDSAGSIGTLTTLLFPIIALLNSKLRGLFFTATAQAITFRGAVDTLTTSMSTFGGAVEKSKRAVLGFMSTVAIGLAIGVAFQGIAIIIDKVINKHENYIETLKNQIEAQQQLVAGLDNIDLTRYGELENSLQTNTPLNAQELEEYNQLQGQILELGYNVVSHYNAEGEAVLKSTEELKKLNDERKEEISLLREKKIEAEKDTEMRETGWRSALGKVLIAPKTFENDTLGIGTNLDQLNNSISVVKEKQEELEVVQDKLENLHLAKSIINDSDLANLSSDKEKMKAEIQQIKNEINNLHDTGKIDDSQWRKSILALNTFDGENFEGLSSIFDSGILNMEENANKLVGKIDEADVSIAEAMEELKGTLDDEFQNVVAELDIDLDTNEGQLAQEISELYINALSSGEMSNTYEAYETFGENISSMLSNIESHGINVDELIQGVPNTVQKFSQLEHLFQSNTSSAELFANVLTFLNEQLATQNANIDGQMALNQIMGERTQILDDYTSKATLLAEAYKQVNAGESLTIAQVDQLTTLFPALSSHVTTHNGVLSITGQILLNQIEIEEGNAKSALAGTIKKLQARRKELQETLKAEQAKIDAFEQTNRVEAQASRQSANYIAQIMAGNKVMNLINLRKNNPLLEPVEASQLKGSFDSVFSSYQKSLQKVQDISGDIKKVDISIGNLESLMNLDFSDYIQNTTAKLPEPKAPKTPKKEATPKAEKETEQMVYITDEFKKKMRELNTEIVKQQELMLNFPSYSKQYQKALSTEISLIKQKIEAINKEEKSLTNQIKTNNIAKKGLVKASEVTRTTTTGGTTRNLYKGLTGQDVKELQKILGIAQDGSYGNATVEAVKRYQRKYGLTVDGNAGKQTLSHMGIWGKRTTTTTATGVAKTYTVKRGDTLGEIASAYGISAKDLANLNKLTNPNLLKVGQKLTIKRGTATTVSNKNASAEMKQAIEEAKDELASLVTDRKALREEMYGKLEELIESEVTRLDREANRMEDDLASNDFLAKKLDETSQEYRQNRERTLELLQLQARANRDSIRYLQSEIASAEKLLNDKLSDAVYDLLQEQKIAYTEIQSQIYDLQQEIAQNMLDEMLDNFEKNVRLSDFAISKLENALSRVQENDLDTFAKINEELASEYEKQISLVNERLKQLYAEENAIKKFPNLYEDWKDQVQELEETLVELDQTLWDLQKETLDNFEDNIEELTDNVKEYFEKMQDLEVEAFEKMRDEEEKIHKERLERYEKETEAYSKSIDEQIEALNKAENEREFQKNLADKEKQRQALMNQIGLVSLDTTTGGKARLRQLQEELSNLNEEIAEIHYDKQLELRTEALEKQKEAREKEADETQKSLEEAFEKQEEQLDKHLDEIERKWENLINNERMFATLREQLLSGNMTEMINMVDTFVERIAESSTEIGESISQNLIDNFVNAKKELLELDAILTDSQINFNLVNQSQSNRITSDIIKNIPLANPYQSIVKNNPNNVPINTLANTTANGQVINLTVNIDSIGGGQEGADEFINAITNGLARKGVTI